MDSRYFDRARRRSSRIEDPCVRPRVGLEVQRCSSRCRLEGVVRRGCISGSSSWSCYVVWGSCREIEEA